MRRRRYYCKQQRVDRSLLEARQEVEAKPLMPQSFQCTAPDFGVPPTFTVIDLKTLYMHILFNPAILLVGIFFLTDLHLCVYVCV